MKIPSHYRRVFIYKLALCGLCDSGLEFLNPSALFNHLLLSGIEGVAIRTDVYSRSFLGRAHFVDMSAGAGDLGLSEILWVNILFHNKTNLIIGAHLRQLKGPHIIDKSGKI